jgi:hypothetical protein
MSPEFTLTVHIIDDSTNLPIPVVVVTDSVGNNQTTSTGTYVQTYPYEAVVLYFIASGYNTESASYIIDSDRTETVGLTKTNVIPQSSTTWYVPKTVSFKVINAYGNAITGANITAKFNSSSTLPSGVSDLIAFYGMNEQAANIAANGTLIMQGDSDSVGAVVFTMLSTLSYDVFVTYGGTTNYFNIHPQDAYYQLRFVALATPETDLFTCVYSNGNTFTGIAAPNSTHMTLMFSYQDTCGLTSALDYYVKDVDNGSFVVYTYHLAPVTAGVYVNNYTVLNTRGKNYIWYENSTRSV